MRILLADDHAVVRRGLRQILEAAFPVEFGEATTAGEAQDLAARYSWDLVILDVTMPGRSGLEALKDIKILKPRLPVLVLSMHPEDQFAVRVLRAGAAGYLNKNSATEELVGAVRTVMAGRRYLSPNAVEMVGDYLAFAQTDHYVPPHQLLSDREFEVFKLIAGGKTVSEIATELSLSVKTISTYRTRILEKMGLKTSAEITRYAFEQHILS